MLFRESLVEEFIASNPASQQAFERAKDILPAGTTRSVLISEPFPLVLRSGNGCSVTSLDGGTYTDFMSDFTAGLYGHSHPVIQEAVTDVLSNGFGLGGVTEKEAVLGNIIRSRFPSIAKLRYCSSGTEANMYAIGTALHFTQRKKILVFDHGYHGGTMNFPDKGNPLNLPHDFVIGRFNDIEDTKKLISYDLAVILVEPLQYAGGVRQASKEFLSFLRDAADSHGSVLIFDECVTSRLHFHGFQGAIGVKPDMKILGKYLGGGFPFGVFGGRDDIMSLFDPSSQGAERCLSHSGTFNGNVFALTAAIAASRLVTPESLDRLNGLGNRLRTSAQHIVEASGFRGMSFSGYGGDIGIHFHGPESAIIRDCLYFFLLRHSFLIGGRGFMSLNLTHSDHSVDSMLQCIQTFVDEYQN